MHTPAPWTHAKFGSLKHGEIYGGGYTVAFVDCRYGAIGEPEANVRLIAAAPELLEALELSTNILAETTGNLPNPGYGWIERKVDARIIKNRAIIKAATG